MKYPSYENHFSWGWINGEYIETNEASDSFAYCEGLCCLNRWN